MSQPIPSVVLRWSWSTKVSGKHRNSVRLPKTTNQKLTSWFQNSSQKGRWLARHGHAAPDPANPRLGFSQAALNLSGFTGAKMEPLSWRNTKILGTKAHPNWGSRNSSTPKDLLILFYEKLPSNNLTWQWKIIHGSWIDDFLIEPPFVEDFPLPRLTPEDTGSAIDQTVASVICPMTFIVSANGVGSSYRHLLYKSEFSVIGILFSFIISIFLSFPGTVMTKHHWFWTSILWATDGRPKKLF